MPLAAGAGRAPLDLPSGATTSEGTPLAVRVLVLDDGATRVALVSITIICLHRELTDQLRGAVAAATGTPPEHIVVACTHVHSGPGEVFQAPPAVREALWPHLVRATAAAAERAARLQPARLGQATDHVPGLSRIRRVLRRDGSVVTLRRAWPQYWGWATDPQTVGPEEPLDDRLTVLRVEGLDGAPLAAVVHFTTHPIPDFFGYGADLVERTLPGVPCLIFNGCQATVDTPFEVPVRGRTQADHLPIFGDVFGFRALELFTRAETSADIPLAVTTADTFLPAHPHVLAAPGMRADIWPWLTQEGGFPVTAQALRLGEMAWVTMPGEVQHSFGARLAEQSPLAFTRVIGMADQEVGYVLWPQSRARGGYEADLDQWALTAEEALDLLLQAGREALAGL
jgi:neutral ceramidase